MTSVAMDSSQAQALHAGCHPWERRRRKKINLFGRSAYDAGPIERRTGTCKRAFLRGFVADPLLRRPRALRLLRSAGADAVLGPRRPALRDGGRLQGHAAPPLPRLRGWRFGMRAVDVRLRLVRHDALRRTAKSAEVGAGVHVQGLAGDGA